MLGALVYVCVVIMALAVLIGFYEGGRQLWLWVPVALLAAFGAGCVAVVIVQRFVSVSPWLVLFGTMAVTLLILAVSVWREHYRSPKKHWSQ